MSSVSKNYERIDRWIDLLEGLRKDLKKDYQRIDFIIDDDIDVININIDDLEETLKELKSDLEYAEKNKEVEEETVEEE